MDVSDEEEPSKKKHKHESSSTNEINALKDENESLKCQMEAYKNEVEVIKIDYKKELEDKEKQFKMLQQTLIGMQQQLSETKKKNSEEELKIKELQAKLKAKNVKNQNIDKDIIDLDSEPEQQDASPDSLYEANSSNNSPLQECDAKLIGVISAFLNVHPFGAGLDYIWSYVSKFGNNLRPSDIELLMTRYPMVFRQEVIGIGANIERRWFFNGFSANST